MCCRSTSCWAALRGDRHTDDHDHARHDAVRDADIGMTMIVTMMMVLLLIIISGAGIAPPMVRPGSPRASMQPFAKGTSLVRA